LAVIFEGIAARARSGNAAADNAAEVGELSVVFVRRGVVDDRFGKSTRSVKRIENYAAI